MAKVFYWSPLFSLAGLLITTPELKPDFFSHPMRCRLSFAQSFFHCKATHWWNLLPSNIKNHVQLSDFKNDVKDYFCLYCDVFHVHNFFSYSYIVIFLCFVCHYYYFYGHCMFLYAIIAYTYVCIPVRKNGSSWVLWLWINQSLNNTILPTFLSISCFQQL